MMLLSYFDLNEFEAISLSKQVIRYFRQVGYRL